MMDVDEATRRYAHLHKLAAFFQAHEAEWIRAVDLEDIGGRQAWRTRVSDCRTKLHMHIENRLQRVSTDHGFVVRSEYRYLKHTPLGRDASERFSQKTLW